MEVGEGEVEEWKRNDWLRTKDETGETNKEQETSLEEEESLAMRMWGAER